MDGPNRAKVKYIAGKGKHKSSRTLASAVEVIAQSPAALQVNSIVSDRRWSFVSVTSSTKVTVYYYFSAE